MRISNGPWYRTSNDAWYVQFEGKQIKLAEGKANKSLARRKWLEFLVSREEPGGTDKSLAACFDYYRATLTPSSARSRAPILNKFLAQVGSMKVVHLSQAVVYAYLKPDWSASTKRTHIKTILAALNLAVKAKLIKANPLTGIDKPAWERREGILSSAELDQLLSAAKEPFKGLLTAMILTGCRPGEACGVLVEDCRPDEGFWLVKNKTKLQTGNKMRTIYLTPELVAMTRVLIGDRKSGHLFINKHGRPWTTDTVRLRFVRLRKKLGLSQGAIPYATRHRFASDAINHHKLDSLIVAKLMGHSNPGMLAKTYYREDPATMIEAVTRATSHRAIPTEEAKPPDEEAQGL